MKLTDNLVRNAVAEAGKRTEIRDDIEPGLILRITETGVKSWSVRYRNQAGEQRRKSLGKYPAIGLARAREEARRAKGAISSGADLVALEQANRAEQRRQRLNTISGLAEAYFEAATEGTHRGGSKSKPKRASTIREEQRIFTKLVEPTFGKIPVSKLTRVEIRDFVSKQTKLSNSNGRHVRNVIRQLLSFAVSMGMIDSNPAMGISAPSSVPRERVMTDDELKLFWKACVSPESFDKLTLPRHMGIALRFAAATLQRRGEVMGARWSEFDLESRVWSIPAGRMKGKRAHAVPLNDMAMQVLAAARHEIGGVEYVFESSRSEKPAPVDSHLLSKAMKRIVTALEMEPATPHDLRRTGATMMTSERIGVARFVVSMVLAHSSDTGGAAAVTGIHYDRNDYLPQKRHALDAWGALLEEIVTGKQRPDNVTKMSRTG
ncbi:tyrosine-type recombinase/integrase [Martelella sp. FOR1707]